MKKQRKYRYAVNLQFFAEDTAPVEPIDSGVEDVPAAGEQTEIPEPNPNVESSDTGVEASAVAEPKKENNFEKAFAKRLAAEREKWEAERRAELEKYKDYEISKKALEYLMRVNNIHDPEMIREQLELAELQEQAERQNMSVEELKRLRELEELKAWKQQVEQQQQEQQRIMQFEQMLKDFCKDKEFDGKPLDYMQLWQFMHENGVSNPETALKAMKADLLEKQIENAKKEAVKEFLSAKGSMPKVEGAKASGTVLPGTPKTFQEARARALQRMGG